jgi:hypothetical protein
MLIQAGIHTVGKIQANRSGLPKNMLFSNNKNGTNHKSDGHIEQYQCNVNNNTLYLSCWQDKRPAYFLSTYPTTVTTVERSKKREHGFERVQLPMPTIAADCNMKKSNVNDTYLKSTFNSKRWENEVYIHGITCSLLNAHILYKQNNYITQTDKLYTYIQFTEEIIIGLLKHKELVGNKGVEMSTKARISVPKRQSILKNNDRLVGYHEPAIYRGCSRRGICMICRTKTNSFCLTCKRACCMTVQNDRISCWTKVHTVHQSEESIQLGDSITHL